MIMKADAFLRAIDIAAVTAIIHLEDDDSHCLYIHFGLNSAQSSLPCTTHYPAYASLYPGTCTTKSISTHYTPSAARSSHSVSPSALPPSM